MRRVVLCLAVVLTASAASGQTPAPSLDSVLARTGIYVGRFIEQFSSVVAEEKYVQDTLGNLPIIMGGRGGVASTAVNPPSRHRELKADFLLVKVGPLEWLPFRDVYEVDGAAVRDREGRLQKLFLKPSATTFEQANQISLESARYNLGNMQRTINTPILALVFLQTDTQFRFKFTLGKRDPTVGDNIWIVDAKEEARPTLVRGARDSDLPSAVRYWIDPDSGRVAKIELNLSAPGIRARVTTSFRRDEKFQIDVPFEMHEQYYLDRGQVSATATYSKFRRFDVSSDETFINPTSVALLTEPKTGMTLVEVGSGRYTMGSPANEPGRRSDETQHDVTLNRPFLIGQHEVTQQEWRAVMNANPSRFADCGPRCPVENVTFAEVQQFIAALNAQSDKTLLFRLPTESEWEYACRAGTITPFATGDTITSAQANINGKQPYGKTPPGLARDKPTRASGFPANAWGVTDMHGNVWEWTSDWYGPYPEEDAEDPSGAPEGDKRVVRGGSWQADAGSARCASRAARPPSARESVIGFRVVAERVRP